MKKLLVPLLLLVGGFAKGQTSVDLSKYSYYIYGQSPSLTIDATCFFVRKSNKLYICGAAHTFTGAVHKGEMPIADYFPDELYVKVYNNNTKRIDEIPINITNIKKSTPIDFFSTHSDVWAMPVSIPKKYQINSIERFICNSIDVKITTKAILYGFPEASNGGKQMCEFDIRTMIQSHNMENNMNNVFTLVVKKGINGHGESGSPLFFITDNKICFAGLYNGIDYYKNSIFSNSTALTNIIK